MEKTYFDKNTFIWKTKLNFLDYKNDILKEVNSRIDSEPNNITDAFELKYQTTKYKNKKLFKNKIDDCINVCIDKCIELHKSKYNDILLGSWINVIRSKNPKQSELMHRHDIISIKLGTFIPDYTFVYYVQMPNNLINNDGLLLIEGENKKMYKVLPEEDDLIIMFGDLPHAPQLSLNSTKDRIVLAGNIKFEYNKKNKTLL